MLHRLCGPPSIPLSFNLAIVLPRWSAYCVCCGTEGSPPTPSTHRLRSGLPGYLILFATHAFEPQRQLQTREPPSPLVFFHISCSSYRIIGTIIFTNYNSISIPYKFHSPLLHSSSPVSNDPPRLSRGLSHQT